MLLTTVIMGQMVVEALLYDLRNPDSGGTCSAAAEYKHLTANTTGLNSTGVNATGIADDATILSSNMTTVGSFPLPLAEDDTRKLVAALATCFLTVPIAFIAFKLLYNLGMAKKSERLWKRLGTSDLSESLVLVRKFVSEENNDAVSVQSFEKLTGLYIFSL